MGDSVVDDLPRVELADPPALPPSSASRVTKEAPRQLVSINITGDACQGCAAAAWFFGWSALILASCVYGFLGFSVEPFVWSNFYLIGILGIIEQIVTAFAYVMRYSKGGDTASCFLMLPVAWCMTLVNTLLIHLLGFLVELVVQHDTSRLDPWSYSAGTLVATSIVLCCCSVMCVCAICTG